MSAPYRFTRQQRLLQAADYQSVFKQAYKSSDRYLVVLARNNEQDGARLGLAISRQIVEKHQGNISRAAKDLGVTRAALYRRLEKHQL